MSCYSLRDLVAFNQTGRHLRKPTYAHFQQKFHAPKLFLLFICSSSLCLFLNFFISLYLCCSFSFPLLLELSLLFFTQLQGCQRTLENNVKINFSHLYLFLLFSLLYLFFLLYICNPFSPLNLFVFFSLLSLFFPLFKLLKLT